jgi:hypothetical protein
MLVLLAVSCAVAGIVVGFGLAVLVASAIIEHPTGQG